MAARNFNRLQALEKEVKSLYLQVAIGASGAPTLTKGLGSASIARNSAGNYTVTLQDKYVRLMGCQVMQLNSSAEDITVQLLAESVSSAKTVQFVCKTDATATDPSSGSKLFIRLDLKNSTAGNS